MPNALATLALALYPLIVLALFANCRVQVALVWSLLLGYLFLPEVQANFDLPLMPELNKHNIPALVAFLAILHRFGTRFEWLPRSALARVLVFVYVLSPVLTAIDNPYPVTYGIVWLPGMNMKQAVALILQQFLLLLPFLMARQFLAQGGDFKVLMQAFVIGALIYSLPMLIEMRMSPQLNRWIYGFHQHDFLQTFRFGGWRPMVFLYHGIWVAFFVMSAVICAAALWRTDGGARQKYYFAAGLYLTVILVLAKSLGAMIFAALLLPLVLLVRPRLQIRIALVLALLATAYPLLKSADLIPEERLLAAAATVDEDRAGSLRFRFLNEERLLERAYEKPLFGWGIFGRNHFFDPNSGMLETVTDGRWIILIGTFGWVGYAAEFGLLLTPLFLLWRFSRRDRAGEMPPSLAPLCLLLAINIVDLLPNATLTTLTWLLAGTLLGQAERLHAMKGKHTGPSRKLSWRSVL